VGSEESGSEPARSRRLVRRSRYGPVGRLPLTREDPDASGEQRFVTLGMSATGALLVVVYSHREPDIYRLISSWKANQPQRKQYEKGRR
jgi:uncharacterized DUF497 family protein